MSDSDTLTAIQNRYSKAFANFTKFEAHVKTAIQTEPLTGNSFDIFVGGWSLVSPCMFIAAMGRDVYGLITCHSLDPFTRKVLGTPEKVVFNDRGEVGDSESMVETDGAANIVARLVVPLLTAS